MDSPAQIDGGSFKQFWIVRFKNVIYKQQQVSVQIIASQNVQKSAPRLHFGMISNESDIKNIAQTTRTIRIDWKP